MLVFVYGFSYAHTLTRLLVGGASATNRYMGHEDGIYSQSNLNHKRLKEILSTLTHHTSTREERIQAGREWSEMTLYDPSRFDEYFAKPSSGKVVQQRLDYYSYEELPT